MKFAIIDNNQDAMQPEQGRGLGFVQSLDQWKHGSDYEFVRYDRIETRLPDLKRCRGLILSGSGFDFALPDNDQFDRATYKRMIPEFRLLLDFRGPILGVCFGHQLIALAEEFDEHRTAFGELRVREMRHPQEGYLVVPIQMNASLRFMNQRALWVQHNHKQEVILNEGLEKYFEVIAGTDQCPVTIMQHKTREWFGVQFHPEVGRVSQKGEISRHEAAVRDGSALMSSFVRYCLR